MLTLASLAILTILATKHEPVAVVTGASLRDASQPQAAVDAAGRVFVAFGTPSAVHVSVSADRAQSFAAPVTLASVGKLSLGMRRGPRIAANEGSVVVTAIAGEQGGGRDGDVMGWRSSDHGATWKALPRLNSEAGSAREGLHAMAGNAHGLVACVWLDQRGDGMKIYGARSTDGGATFTKDALVYRSAERSVCECCHPSVAVAPDGTVFVMFRNQLAGARDLYLLESKDGGVTFAEARKLDAGTWKLAACPMDGGSIAALGASSFRAVWRRDADLFRAASPGTEARVASGFQPWNALTEQGEYVAWSKTRAGDLLLLAPGAATPRTIASAAVDVVLAAPVGGKSPVIAVWESADPKAAPILALRIDSDD